MKNIFIYDKDKESLEFLKGFFTGHPLYMAEFFADAKGLRKRLREASPYVLIVGSCCMNNLVHANNDYNVVAMLSKDITGGMKQVINNNVENYLIQPFYKEDLEYKLAIFTRKLEHFRALYQEKKDIEAISELTYILSSTLDPQEVLYLIVKKLSELIPVTRCSILSIRTFRDKTLDVVSTFEDPKIKHLKLDLRKYPEIRKAIRTKQPVVISDASKDPLMKEVKGIISKLGIKSIIVVPILFRSEVIGTLFLRTSRKNHVFADREVTLCTSISTAAANALNNAYLFEEIKSERAELEKLAITDFLTGIYNIRYLYHRLENEYNRASRYGSDLSCIMFDIDYFKRINDNYGHRTGDMVLREFATLIKNNTRKSDIFARYGGEEFIIIMPNTPVDGAVTESERLSTVIREHKFKGLKKDTRITISIGIATYPNRKIQTQDDLISFADDALLTAKESGRDRIIVQK